MIIQQFFKIWDGKYNELGSYPRQCVSIVKQYFQDILGLPIFVGNAKDYWTNPPQGFTKIKNSPINSPQLGDLVIWDIKPFGHIAICQSAGIWSLTSFDQNWPISSPCHFQKHNYKNCLGWLRPLPVVPVFVFPKVPLQIARLGFLGLQLPPIGEFQAQVGIYSNSRISLNTTDYGTPFTIPSVGMLNQDDAYRIVDLVNPKEKFIFIFYPPNNTSSFLATYYYPKRDSVISTCPSTDPRLLAFEFSHQLGIYAKTHGHPEIEILDSNYPDDNFIQEKYNLVSKYYNPPS